ncbi:hypothetical protein BDV06DRAFT_181638 [Aspergillus oleicola]
MLKAGRYRLSKPILSMVCCNSMLFTLTSHFQCLMSTAVFLGSCHPSRVTRLDVLWL